MSSTLGNLCKRKKKKKKKKKNLLIQSNSCEDVVLNVDTNVNQNLKLLLSAGDFHFCLGTQGVPLLCPPASVAKKSILVIDIRARRSASRTPEHPLAVTGNWASSIDSQEIFTHTAQGIVDILNQK